MHRTSLRKLLGVVSISWTVFAGVFLYYAALVLLIVSGVALGGSFVVVSYALPEVAYVLLVLARVGRAVARLDLTLAVPQAAAG